MAEPGREAVPGIVLHRAHLGRGSERIGNPLGGTLVVCREADPDMAVVEDRVVRPVSLLDLVQRLRDQEALQAVAGHESQGAFEEVQASERGKLIEHQEQPVASAFGLQVLGQPSADLVEDQADQRLGAACFRPG